MESKTKTLTKPPRDMKRSSSSNSESLTHFESPHSPLRFHSPLRSDQGDPPETPPYVSPIGSPEKLPPDNNSKAIISINKSTQFSPFPSPLPPSPIPPYTPDNGVAKSSPMVVFNRAVREDGHQATTTKVGPATGGGSGTASSRTRRTNTGGMGKMFALGFRLCEVVFCLISFSVMAADKTKGWSGDSFDRYKEYRYCLSMNVIAFVYAGFQACDLAYYMAKEKHVINHHLRRPFSFFMDQILAYLLISASSSAATRVDDWQSNWGKDEFTKMASASIAMSFLAFIAFACSSLISGYNLSTRY